MSETGFISVIKWPVKPTLMGPLVQPASPNSNLKAEIEQIFETSC
jgi:hypothetical protein